MTIKCLRCDALVSPLENQAYPNFKTAYCPDCGLVFSVSDETETKVEQPQWQDFPDSEGWWWRHGPQNDLDCVYVIDTLKGCLVTCCDGLVDIDEKSKWLKIQLPKLPAQPVNI